MYTDSLPSGQMINEEPCLEQYTGYQTSRHSPARPPSEILKCALQELGIVYHRLQGADQHNLCSKDILQAAMSELNSVSWLLQSAMQQSILYSQPEPSPHLQCPEEELLNFVMPENQDSRFLQSPRGGGHSHHTFQRYSSSPTACCPHFWSACRLAPAAQIYRSHRSDHSTCYLPCYLSWQSS